MPSLPSLRTTRKPASATAATGYEFYENALGQARGDGPPLKLPFEATVGQNAGGKIISAQISPKVHRMVLCVKGKRGAYQFAVESRGGIRPVCEGAAPMPLRHDPDIDIEC